MDLNHAVGLQLFETLSFSATTQSHMNRSTSRASFFHGTASMYTLSKPPSKKNAASKVHPPTGTGLPVSCFIFSRSLILYYSAHSTSSYFRCFGRIWLDILPGLFSHFRSRRMGWPIPWLRSSKWRVFEFSNILPIPAHPSPQFYATTIFERRSPFYLKPGRIG